jgi:metal-responsive CopG/Arc/MetJ family transcriptional regulator
MQDDAAGGDLMPNSDRASLKRQKTVRTTVSLPTDNYRELERLAERKKVSIAWVIREAVDNYLAQQSPLFSKR